MKSILGLLGKPESLIAFTDRPGHDLRYAIDASRSRAELGWPPPTPSRRAWRETVRWFVDHRAWWERVLSGEYQKYYQRQYQARPAPA